MFYDPPGRSDKLSVEILREWNNTIKKTYDNQGAVLKSRFFSIDPSKLVNPSPASIKWFADPAEPNFCIDRETAQKLSDWDERGRHALHNEYCEYRVIKKLDESGQMRPKRVEITTELREYWVCLAKYDPRMLQTIAKEILGFQPTWEELYGVNDPFRLTITQREERFSTLVAGNERDSVPSGTLNNEHALFMTHPINGLDDLLYIVMFGAKPYANKTSSGYEPATREQIFRKFNVTHLACRHADPAAAMGAHGAAFNGCMVSFVNPIGMYILSFTKEVFSFHNNSLPESWIRWSRGEKGMYQRLEFGPSDNEPYFLDDITVSIGDHEERLTGGYQVLQYIEVGPLVVVGEPTTVKDDEYVNMDIPNEPIICSQASVCDDTIRPLKELYDNIHKITRIAPRITILDT